MKKTICFLLLLLSLTACNKQLDLPLAIENPITPSYLNDTEQRHYVVGFISSRDVNKLKNQFSDFNKQRSEEKRVSNIYLAGDTNKPFFIIRYFDNLPDATVLCNSF